MIFDGVAIQTGQSIAKGRRSQISLLVTTAGPGRIEARCFPIPPHGKMKFKLGITSPLTLVSERQAVLETPRIVHSNFQALSTADAYFESRTLLMQLLDVSTRAQGVQIFIGGESGIAPLDECSVVTAPYEVQGQVVGTVGVIGPTRMAYERVIPIVDVTAKLLSSALSQT